SANMCAQVHSCSVPPAEERFTCSLLSFDEINGSSTGLIIDRFHSFLCERTSVLNSLFTDFTKARVHRCIIGGAGFAFQHTARSPLRFKGWVLWIIGQFRFFFRIEVIEITEEFIEAIYCRQRFVAITHV